MHMVYLDRSLAFGQALHLFRRVYQETKTTSSAAMPTAMIPVEQAQVLLCSTVMHGVYLDLGLYCKGGTSTVETWFPGRPMTTHSACSRRCF